MQLLKAFGWLIEVREEGGVPTWFHYLFCVSLSETICYG